MTGECRGMRERAVDRLGAQAHELARMTPQQPGRDGADEQKLRERLCQLDDAARGEHAFQAGHGIELAEVGSEGLEAQVPAADGDRGKESRHERETEERRTRDEGVQHLVREDAESP